MRVHCVCPHVVHYVTYESVIRDESDTSTRLDTLRIEYEDRLLGEGDTYP